MPGYSSWWLSFNPFEKYARQISSNWIISMSFPHESESTHCGRRTGEEADTVTGSLLRTSRRSTPEKNQRTLKTTIGLWTKTGFNKALLMETND